MAAVSSSSSSSDGGGGRDVWHERETKLGNEMPEGPESVLLRASFRSFLSSLQAATTSSSSSTPIPASSLCSPSPSPTSQVSTPCEILLHLLRVSSALSLSPQSDRLPWNTAATACVLFNQCVLFFFFFFFKFKFLILFHSQQNRYLRSVGNL